MHLNLAARAKSKTSPRIPVGVLSQSSLSIAVAAGSVRATAVRNKHIRICVRDRCALRAVNPLAVKGDNGPADCIHRLVVARRDRKAAAALRLQVANRLVGANRVEGKAVAADFEDTPSGQ